MYCAKKLPDFSVGKINVLINALIYLVAAIRYDFEIAAYSMVFAVAAGFVTDCTHDQNIKIAAFIVTENKMLGDRISKAVCRGVTSWEAVSYTHLDCGVEISVAWIRRKKEILSPVAREFTQMLEAWVGEVLG